MYSASLGRPIQAHWVPQSMRLFWQQISTAFADRTYIVYEDERYTFAETWALTTRAASIFHDVYGVHKGDRVAIAMRNYPEVFFNHSVIQMYTSADVKPCSGLLHTGPPTCWVLSPS